VRSIAHGPTLQALIDRLRRLRPDQARRWGTLTAGEMLCHLGDAHELVLGRRAPAGPRPPVAPRRLRKWYALHVPLPWPRGVQGRPDLDPRQQGTPPGDFEADRTRAIESLAALAAAPPPELAPAHRLFGPMSAADWRRWAFLHVDHHLRQFGL
jgi:hypothetical protein